MAAAYNALVWFVIREVIDNWRDGVPGCYGWLLTLFAVPLAMIGLVLAGASVYLFLRLFNPRPTVQLSTGMICAGAKVDVGWQIRGSVARMRRLRIFAEGREEFAVPHHGSIRTQVETFMTLPMVDATELSQMREGHAELAIPADARPSTRTSHMRVIWVLRICGDVRRWPNVDEQFEFALLPQAETQQPLPAT
jgi:hypothetical protein